MKEVPEDSDEAKKWPLWSPSSAGLPEPGPSQPSELSLATGSSAPSLSKPVKKPGPRKPKTSLVPLPGAQKAKRRRPEYDSDDDFPAGTHRQNEYDREDDFIAPSDDEQMSGVDDDDDEEDILDDDDEEEEEAPRKKRQKTADAEDDDADADADADLDDIDAPAVESSRARRRNIIDQDDDE